MASLNGIIGGLRAWRNTATNQVQQLGCLRGKYGVLVDGRFTPYPNAAQSVFSRPDCLILGTQKSGTILFGAPPEVIKNLMSQNIGVPNVLVLNANWVKNGNLMNELEFVLYHNIFFQGKRMKIVGTREQLASARAILQESFFGPAKDNVKHIKDLEAAGYYEKELEHFRAGLAFVLKKIDPERDPAKGLPQLDEFVEFVECNIGGSVKFKDGKVAGEAEDFDAVLTQTEHGRYVLGDPGAAATALIDTTTFRPVETPPTEFAESRVDAPDFGVTFLGTGHGFARGRRTVSMVLWSNGKGMLIDPLADPKGTLHKYGIEEDQIPFIFLSHVHADHDAGAVRMVLNGKRIKLITSQVIYESLLRKCRAMGVDAARYIDFIQVAPGETLNGAKIGLPGLTLAISAALHSVPTIRFTAMQAAEGKQKSLFYSSDTFYHPEEIQKLSREKGVLSEERAADLSSFGWDQDFVIHEAGIAPIHTPQSVLQATMERLGKQGEVLMVHIEKADEGITIPVAAEGKTLTIIPRPHASQQQIYDAIGDNLLLGQVPMVLAKEIVRMGRVTTFHKGDTVIVEGSRGNSFFFIVEGRTSVMANERLVATLGNSDYFGEAALLTGRPRNASVVADTTTTVLEFPASLFSRMLRQMPMIRESMLKTLSLRPLISKVHILSALPKRVIDDLISRLHEVSFPAGEDIVVQGEQANQFFLIKEGVAEVIVENNGQSRKVAELGSGDVFGEIALIENSSRTATVRAASDIKVLALDRQDFNEITSRTPSLHFILTNIAAERKRTNKLIGI